MPAHSSNSGVIDLSRELTGFVNRGLVPRLERPVMAGIAVAARKDETQFHPREERNTGNKIILEWEGPAAPVIARMTHSLMEQSGLVLRNSTRKGGTFATHTQQLFTFADKLNPADKKIFLQAFNEVAGSNLTPESFSKESLQNAIIQKKWYSIDWGFDGTSKKDQQHAENKAESYIILQKFYSSRSS